MIRFVTLLAWGLPLAFTLWGCSANSEQSKATAETDEAKAIAEIENGGGKVVADKDHPGQVGVWFQGSKVTDAGLIHLKNLPQVRMLVLDSTSVTDAGMANLEGLTTLHWLSLKRTQVTDAGLDHLKGLTNLEILKLAHAPITDAGLVDLKGLTMLQGLDLNDTQVTDAGLVHLKGLTKLQSLDLGETKVTYAGGVKGLQKVLPSCTILFGSPVCAVTRRSKRSDDESLVRLLILETVQKDLGLTAYQIGTIKDCVKTSQEQYREFLAKSREIRPAGTYRPEDAEASQQKFHALQADYARQGQEMRKKVLAMLTPSQSERLKQIELQTAVAAALERPEIIHALQISDEQRDKMDALIDHLSGELSPPDLRHLNSKERRQKMTEFMKQSKKVSTAVNELVLDVLTPEQRAKFEKLEGRKIEVTWPYDELLPEDITF